MRILKSLLPKMGQYHSKLLPLTYKKYPTKEVILNSKKVGHVTAFDVSQMNYIEVKKSTNTEKLIENIFPINITRLKENKGELSVVLDEKCNILDDFVVTNMGDRYRFIVNSESIPLFNEYFSKKNIEYKFLSDKKILSIQGDGAINLMNDFELPTEMKFMENINYNEMEITRCGYTDMDGFEIIGNEDNLEYLIEKMIEKENINFGGLIERDILRLEAGFCLSGNEFGENLNVHFNEADLNFIIKKKRRDDKSFFGGEYLDISPTKIRRNLISNISLLNQKDIYNNKEDVVGVVTSASYSYNLGKFIGMGYINIEQKDNLYIKRSGKYHEINLHR
jgi:aminomethyltransferase